MPRHCKKSGRRTQALRLPSWGAALLRPYQKADYHFLIAGWASQSVDERAGTRRVIPHLERRIEVEDVRRGETTAGAINREHRVAIDFVEVDVFEHGTAPVRQIQEVDASLIRVDAGLDRDAAHGF